MYEQIKQLNTADIVQVTYRVGDKKQFTIVGYVGLKPTSYNPTDGILLYQQHPDTNIQEFTNEELFGMPGNHNRAWIGAWIHLEQIIELTKLKPKK